jgi:TolB protein
VRRAASLAAAFLVVAAPAAHAAFPGRNGRIAFQRIDRHASHLFTLNLAGGIPRPFAPRVDDGREPAWSPAGTMLAFQRARTGTLALARSDGTRVRALTVGQGVDTTPAWSPDARFIAFASDRNRLGGQADLWMIDRLRRVPRPFLTTPTGELSPAWSPDGRWIAFASARDGDAEIYKVRPTGGLPIRLTKNDDTEDEPAWSPDGRRIAFVSDRSGQPEIYTMRADGSRVRRLTRNPLSDQDPAWSPDGRFIVFARGPNQLLPNPPSGHFHLWVMDADGSGRHQITWLTGFDDVQPDWQPLKSAR